MNKIANRLCRNREESGASWHSAAGALLSLPTAAAVCLLCLVKTQFFSFFSRVRQCAGAAINETKLKAEPCNGCSLKFKHVSP